MHHRLNQCHAENHDLRGRGHDSPAQRRRRNVAGNGAHRQPIIAVTGTNGKTTSTSRLIAHILGRNVSIVGMTSADAVIIDNIPIINGDYSGPEGARKVMMDSTVDMSVFEVARGGIETLEKLTRLRSTLADAVKPSGYAVFYASDASVLSCMERTPGHPVLLSNDPKNPASEQIMIRETQT